MLKIMDFVFSKFKQWKELFENLTGIRIKRFRIDKGLELCNNEFNEYYRDHGIERHRTTRMTPQKNGIEKG